MDGIGYDAGVGYDAGAAAQAVGDGPVVAAGGDLRGGIAREDHQRGDGIHDLLMGGGAAGEEQHKGGQEKTERFFHGWGSFVREMIYHRTKKRASLFPRAGTAFCGTFRPPPGRGGTVARPGHKKFAISYFSNRAKYIRIKDSVWPENNKRREPYGGTKIQARPAEDQWGGPGWR